MPLTQQEIIEQLKKQQEGDKSLPPAIKAVHPELFNSLVDLQQESVRLIKIIILQEILLKSRNDKPFYELITDENPRIKSSEINEIYEVAISDEITKLIGEQKNIANALTPLINAIIQKDVELHPRTISTEQLKDIVQQLDTQLEEGDKSLLPAIRQVCPELFNSLKEKNLQQESVRLIKIIILREILLKSRDDKTFYEIITGENPRHKSSEINDIYAVGISDEITKLIGEQKNIANALTPLINAIIQKDVELHPRTISTEQLKDIVQQLDTQLEEGDKSLLPAIRQVCPELFISLKEKDLQQESVRFIKIIILQEILLKSRDDKPFYELITDENPLIKRSQINETYAVAISDEITKLIGEEKNIANALTPLINAIIQKDVELHPRTISTEQLKDIVQQLDTQLEEGDKSLLPAIRQVCPELFISLKGKNLQQESVRLIKIIILQEILLKSRVDKPFYELITGENPLIKRSKINDTYAEAISDEITKLIGEEKNIVKALFLVIDAIIKKDVALRSRPQETSLLDQADKPEQKKQQEPMPPVNAIREKTQQEEPSVLPVVEKAAAVDVLKEPGQHVDVPLGVQQPARPVHTAVPEPGEETQKKEEPSALPVVGKVAALDVQKETVQHVDKPLVLPQAEQPVRTDVPEPEQGRYIMPLTQQEIIEQLKVKLEEGDKTLLPAIKAIHPELFNSLKDLQQDSFRLISLIVLQNILLGSRTNKQFQQDITGRNLGLKLGLIKRIYEQNIPIAIRNLRSDRDTNVDAVSIVSNEIVKKDVQLHPRTKNTEQLKTIVERLNKQRNEGEDLKSVAEKAGHAELFIALDDPEKQSVRLIKVIVLQNIFLKLGIHRQFSQDLFGRDTMTRLAMIRGIYQEYISEDIRNLIGDRDEIVNELSHAIDAIRKQYNKEFPPRTKNIEQLPAIVEQLNAKVKEHESLLSAIEVVDPELVVPLPLENLQKESVRLIKLIVLQNIILKSRNDKQFHQDITGMATMSRPKIIGIHKECISDNIRKIVGDRDEIANKVSAVVSKIITEDVEFRSKSQEERLALTIVKKARYYAIKDSNTEIQASIATFTRDISSIEKTLEKKTVATLDTTLSVEELIPTAHKLLSALEEAFKIYKDQIGEGTPEKDRALAKEFKESCQSAINNFTAKGLDQVPLLGDAVNNVLNAIINALNHLISSLGKLWNRDSSYTFFQRKDYTSPELRDAFKKVSSIGEATLPEHTEQDILSEEPKDGPITPV